MRSVNGDFKQVEGHDNLIRDVSSNAIISNSQEEYKNYMAKRRQEINYSNLVKKNVEEIDQLKRDLQEIKALLLSFKNKD